MLSRCLAQLRQRVQRGVDALRTRVSRWTRPGPVGLAAGLAADLTYGGKAGWERRCSSALR